MIYFVLGHLGLSTVVEGVFKVLPFKRKRLDFGEKWQLLLPKT